MISTHVVEQPAENVRRQTAAARRRCPRCNGNLFMSREDYGTALHCLQCGREFALMPAPTAASRAA